LLADQIRSQLSRVELTPLGQGGSAVLLEDIATVEVPFLIEMIVDRGVGGDEFLKVSKLINTAASQLFISTSYATESAE